MTTVSLLGPQRLQPTVEAALAGLGVEGPVGAITAGWQERESETGDLEKHLRRPIVNLELYQRAEEMAVADPELFEALRGRQDRFRRMQRLYRIRLDYTLAAARDLLSRSGSGENLREAQRGAMRALRVLDREHFNQIREVHSRFDAHWNALERPAVARHREELHELLGGCSALLVAGGHVAILLNRLRLFGAHELAGEIPVVAWSAGAMALAERVVLFHDSPPQGAGNAEVLEVGLGIAPGVLPLPDAKRRLRLEDPTRVSLFSRRFKPLRSVPLDDGHIVTRRDGSWRIEGGVECLTTEGTLGRCFEAGPAQ